MVNSPTESGIGLLDLIRVLRRHSGKAIFVSGLLFVLCLVAIYFLPRKYESESLLFVRIGRESVTLDPTVTTGQTMTLNESRESELNSILETISSRAMMERVVDQLGPEAILEPPSDGSDSESDSALAEWTGKLSSIPSLLEPGEPISLREKAVQTLLKSVYVSNTRKSYIISIYYQAKTPDQAQLVAKTIADEYLLEHRRIHQARGSYDFFQKQSEMFSKDLKTALNNYRKAKDDLGVSSIEGARQLVESQIEKLSTESLSAQTALATSKAKIASLETAIAKLPERVDSQQIRGMPNGATDRMRQQLFELEIKQLDLLSKFKDEHPEVIAVAKALEGTKQIMRKQEASRTHSTTILNPSLQKFNQELLAERVIASSLSAQEETLNAQLAKAQTKLTEVNKQETQIQNLQREIQLAETNFFTYAEKLEQARIEQSLDEEQISNVTITQPATLVEKPVSPRKAFVLVASFLFSALGGLVVAIRSELKHPRIQDQAEAEATLGVPVLVTIPRVRRDRVLMNEKVTR